MLVPMILCTSERAAKKGNETVQSSQTCVRVDSAGEWDAGACEATG